MEVMAGDWYRYRAQRFYIPGGHGASLHRDRKLRLAPLASELSLRPGLITKTP